MIWCHIKFIYNARNTVIMSVLLQKPSCCQVFSELGDKPTGCCIVVVVNTCVNSVIRHSLYKM